MIHTASRDSTPARTPTRADLVARCQQRLSAYGTEHQYEGTSGYVPFQVTVRLTSAIGGNDLSHLDALLSWCVVQDALQGAPVPQSSTRYVIPLPLESVWQGENGAILYHNTSLFPEGHALHGVSYWTKRNDAMGPRFARRKMNGEVWQADNGSGTNREYLTALRTLSTKTLLGYGVGNISEIQRLFQFLMELGKKRSQGLGQISRVEIVPYMSKTRYVFLQEGRLLRPVPHEALSALGYQPSQNNALQMIAYMPPYWHVLNKTLGYPEQTEVKQQRGPGISGSIAIRRWSVADFLLFCQRHEMQQKVARREPVDLILAHPKHQPNAGQGEVCAFSGLPIGNEGGVPAKAVFRGEMGNVVDFLKAPDSAWVSHSSALVLSQQRAFHRSFVALISPDEQHARLLWPTMAVDPTNPQQERPLWREMLIALADQYLGYRCLIICKDEPKSRLWPRTRQGVVGVHTPIYLSDTDLSYQDLLFLNIEEAKRQMLRIESWFDEGYSRSAIRSGALMPPTHRIQEALIIQQELEAMQSTPEFLFAWRVARFRQERDKRKGSN